MVAIALAVGVASGVLGTVGVVFLVCCMRADTTRPVIYTGKIDSYTGKIDSR